MRPRGKQKERYGSDTGVIHDLALVGLVAVVVTLLNCFVI